MSGYSFFFKHFLSYEWLLLVRGYSTTGLKITEKTKYVNGNERFSKHGSRQREVHMSTLR